MSDLPMQNRVQGGGGGGQTAINPASLSIEDMSRLLSAAGGAGGGGGKKISVEQIREDIEGGAPVDKDGRMNLVHYAAWLAREVQGENP